MYRRPYGRGEQMITLIRIAMVRPNAGVYAPGPQRQITEDEFMVRYADNPHVVQVSFEPDGVSNPQPVTAYGFGFDCWWIVTGVDN